MILNLFQKFYFTSLILTVTFFLIYDIIEHKKLINKVNEYKEPSLKKIIQDIINQIIFDKQDTDLQDFTKKKAIETIQYSFVCLIGSLLSVFLLLLVSLYVVLKGLNMYVISIISVLVITIFILTFSSIQLILDYDSAVTTAREYKRLNIFNITLIANLLTLMYISSGIALFVKTKFNL